MPRDHARLYTRIWADKDFRALPALAQRTYFVVLSDPSLTHLGTAPFRPRRWSQLAPDTGEHDFRESLDILGQRRFLVIDTWSEDVLVRSLMRHDQVFKLPNVAKSAYAAWKAVDSPLLRAHALFEVHRIHEGPAAGKNDKSFEPDYVAGWLAEPFPDGFPEGPDDGPPEGSAERFDSWVREVFPEPWPTGFSRAYARAHSPSPSSSTSTAAAGGVAELRAAVRKEAS